MTEEQKREEWERLKEKAPDLALAMKLHVLAFGKPPAYEITWKEER